uniref:DNA mismatch repair protein S5 domain-containing protein n=1 Tax=Plectus sambesii TaxID=2011161 RepID=A0A914VK55_9BILA
MSATQGGEAGMIRKLPELVINQIAAGEVVQRPANAVKELIENSLDAQATQITISARAGGLKLLQVQDNGKGIARADMDIVCERHTTSKLRELEDLQTIASFGFRGEALASVSHVAHVSLTSRTADAPCAYTCEYADGKPKAPTRLCAGNAGTTVTVEDLFFNQPTRTTALKSATDELNKIADVVTRYAVHNPAVSFTLRRFGAGSDLRTPGSGTVPAAITALFGSTVAKDMVALETKSAKLFFELRGWLARPLFLGPVANGGRSSKKSMFMLFINERSVECRQLKQAIDLLFSTQDVVCPLVYLDLKIDPRRVDVNCHPTKNHVQFLDQTAVFERVQEVIEDALTGCVQQSRCHATLSASPSGGRPMTNQSITEFCSTSKKETTTTVVVSEELGGPSLNKISSDAPKKLYDHQLIRTDSSEQRLTAFLTPNANAPDSSSSSALFTQLSQSTTRRVCVELNASQQNKSPASNLGENGGSQSTSQRSEGAIVTSDIVIELEGAYGEETGEPTWRRVQLQSIDTLRRKVCQTASATLRDLFKSHTFVGCVDPRRALIQHLTTLYMVDVEKLSEELFYQVLLFRFGNFGSFKLTEWPLLSELYEMALAAGDDGVAEKEAESPAAFLDLLRQFGPMLQDYYSLSISDENRLVAVPSILSNYYPQLEGLPQLVYDLAVKVQWDEEQSCLEGVCRSLSRFFAHHALFCDGEMHSALGHSAPWREIVEMVLFPAFKAKLLPPSSFLNDGTITQMADLKDLYRVFERC